MRLWTIHPKYLDPVGLVALWREALLARAVLRGATRGYRHHPQLIRFRAHSKPVRCINEYLAGVYAEAARRGYSFDRRKLGRGGAVQRMRETRGQVSAEWNHLLRKLRRRDPKRYRTLVKIVRPSTHPLFRVVPGGVRKWEKSGGKEY